jgi:hypothetical protein
MGLNVRMQTLISDKVGREVLEKMYGALKLNSRLVLGLYEG